MQAGTRLRVAADAKGSGYRCCTIVQCNRRLTVCKVIWEDSQQEETVNLNKLNYRAAPDEPALPAAKHAPQHAAARKRSTRATQSHGNHVEQAGACAAAADSTPTAHEDQQDRSYARQRLQRAGNVAASEATQTQQQHDTTLSSACKTPNEQPELASPSASGPEPPATRTPRRTRAAKTALPASAELGAPVSQPFEHEQPDSNDELPAEPCDDDQPDSGDELPGERDIRDEPGDEGEEGTQLDGEEGTQSEEEEEEEVEEGALDVLADEEVAQATTFLTQVQLPEVFLQPNPQLAQQARELLQVLYSYNQRCQQEREKGAQDSSRGQSAAGEAWQFTLPQLHVDSSFDAEQVWMQLDMALRPSLTAANRTLQGLPSNLALLDQETEAMLEDLLSGPGGMDEVEEDMQQPTTALGGEDAMDAVEDDSGDDGDAAEDAAEDDAAAAKGATKRKDLEDQFFRYDDLEAFLQQGEDMEARDEDGSEDDEEGGMDSGEEDEEGGALDASEEEEGLQLHKDLDVPTRKKQRQLDPEEAALEALLDEEWQRQRGGHADSGDGAEEEDDDMEEASHDDHEGDLHYADFFQPEAGKRGAQAKSKAEEHRSSGHEDAEEQLSEGTDEERLAGHRAADGGAPQLSRHERALQELRARMQRLEEENLGEKEWFYRGEVKAGDRPLNSALEVDMDFDRNVAPPPQATEEGTMEIEDLIKKRIADQQFDDVVRIVAPPPEKQKAVIELDDTQAQQGLGDVYAQDYLAAKGEVAPGQTDKHQALRDEATKLFKVVMAKLDALSHFHFTPKPLVEDVSIRADVPALMMEEVAPQVTSAAVMQTAGEVFQPTAPGGLVRENGELTREERKAARGKRKRARRKAKAAEVASKQTQPAALGGQAPLSGRKSEAVQQLQQQGAKQRRKGGKAIKQGLKGPGAGPRLDYTKSSVVFSAIEEARQGKGQRGSVPSADGDQGRKQKASLLKL